MDDRGGSDMLLPKAGMDDPKAGMDDRGGSDMLLPKADMNDRGGAFVSDRRIPHDIDGGQSTSAEVVAGSEAWLGGGVSCVSAHSSVGDALPSFDLTPVQGEPFSRLPLEIFAEICSWLDSSDIRCLPLVSRSFNQVISRLDRAFIFSVQAERFLRPLRARRHIQLGEVVASQDRIFLRVIRDVNTTLTREWLEKAKDNEEDGENQDSEEEGDSAVIEDLARSGMVPLFVQFLGRDDFPELQLEAAEVLGTISCFADDVSVITVIVDQGAIPSLVKLLDSPMNNTREAAVRVLNNIAGASPQYRDIVLGHGALTRLLAQLTDNAEPSMQRKAAWTLANFCMGRPQPSYEQQMLALQALQKLILANDEKVLAEACRALYYLSGGTNYNIQLVIEAGVLPRLVELLHHPDEDVASRAAFTIVSISFGTVFQTQSIIDCGALPHLLSVLTHTRLKHLKVTIVWTLSNILAGSEEQIQAVIDAGFIGALLSLREAAEPDLEKRIFSAISNAFTGGNDEQVGYLASLGCEKLLPSPSPTLSFDTGSSSIQDEHNIDHPLPDGTNFHFDEDRYGHLAAKEASLPQEPMSNDENAVTLLELPDGSCSKDPF